MKNYNMTFTEKLQIYQHYDLTEMTIMNILQVKKYWLSLFTYSPLAKAFERKAKEIK